MESSNHFHIEQLSATLTDGSNAATENTQQELDVLVVGAGFAGIYQLKHLRDLGYKALLVDNGSEYGGTWYWNRYPGIRVDTSAPQYQFSDPDLRKDFEFKQRFPGGVEIRKYLKHVTERWDVRKDTKFDTYIASAAWDNEATKWSATAADGTTYRAKFLVLCTGCLVDEFVPKWKDVDKYTGQFFHSSSWPRKAPNFKGKKVAVIGTGASAVQIIQELANAVDELTVFQRTPNTALPMRQVDYDEVNKPIPEDEVRESLAVRMKSFCGFDFTFLPRKCFEDTPEKRLQTYENLWKEGDFKYWLGTYIDTLFVEEANRECYNFWRDKTRARIHDPKVADLLAPMEPAYAFGTKRIPLEQGYFEIFNSPHVELVDLKATPIERFTEKGIKTSAEEMPFDIVIAATGFDALTGSLTRINLHGKDGTLLKDQWKDGVKTYLGLTAHNFPNLFFQYGPQAPSVLCNGPTCAELQGNWVIETITHCRDHGISTIEATEAAEEEWRGNVVQLAGASLLMGTNSWYVGANIPGKLREPLVYLGGVPKYYENLNAVRDHGYEGFVLEGGDGTRVSKL
ncbi:FAD/NAD(P)-binding domain-containing protein [Bimuria novae-zelandiae CBS 107.79]|uniref:FAD/NAD(P)-binding domain-containing protein n=1 Tax=Bimuria novae-zelandiae CBS 107.79 TaxID=1447943 RepID=A0A6A5V9K0_9PLEO|nr:FAD/NAD(P)-binding domain-containing protein [Bimuria novae-zelandiae CBS 107.79]